MVKGGDRTLARAWLAAVVILVAMAALGASVATAAAPDPAAQQLADRHAPVMMLIPQDEQCDTEGEQYEPMAVDLLLDNPQVFLRQVGTNNPVLANGAGASALFDLGEGFYLDFPGNALDPGCIYERDFRRYSEGREPVVYAHIISQEDEPGKLALQYWFYWYYNDWNNKHEGDWEGIQLLFEADSIEEALRTEPVSVGYAQHEGGERADWDDDKLERRGQRPVVYPSRGSHASYYGSSLYLGRSGSEGFGCDLTEGASRALSPTVVVLPDAVDDRDAPLAWLDFEGRWGERQSGPFNGPTGPGQKDRWLRPVDWHDDLRSSSVAVPAGDVEIAGTQLIATFCAVVEWGSAQLILLREDPALLLLGLVAVIALVSFILRRTDWSRVEPLPIERRRRAGQIIRAAAHLYWKRRRPFLEIGLIYIPVALTVGIAILAISALPLIGALLESDQDLGAVGVFIAGLVGSLGYVIGFSIASATVAGMMGAIDRGMPASGRQAYRYTFRRLGGLLPALGRAVVIVGLLLISIVGIPWGIRQTVRYQFLAPVAILEDMSGQAVLDRSTALVRGRWFHTAAVIVLLNALVAAVSIAAGLILLVVLAGIPLWLFSILITVVAALVVPYNAIALVLLYGDARAEEESEPRAEPVLEDAHA